jgi:hypothetical protein
MSSDLDVRIAAAFRDGVKSSDVSALIIEAETAAEAADLASARARECALDPALPPSAVAGARQQMQDGEFRSSRLKTAVSQLHKRVHEVRALEEQERRWAAYQKLKTERDKLAAELKAVYPSFEESIAQLVAKIDASDREIDYLNSQALPTGAERLRSAELIAREIAAFRINQTDVVRITRELCLPQFRHDPHRPYAWPRSR